MSVRLNLNKEVLRLSLPSILANVTIPLVGIVDTAIVGHLSDSVAIGGIAIGTMLFDLLYWNFGFLRVGTAGMTAQSWGREYKQHGCIRVGSETADILLQSVTLALIATAAIWLIQYFFVEAVLAIVPCSEGVASFAKKYFYIRIWAAPATLLLFTFKGWFIGMQNSIAPMTCDLTVNIVNMLASYLLAVHTPTGLLGVAYGTVIAQYTGLAVALVFLIVRYRYLFSSAILSRLRELLRWARIKNLFILNGNLFIRSLCFMIIYVGFTGIAAVYGDDELAISSIMMKLFMLFSYFIDGFAYAGEALTGRFYGEKKQEEVNNAVRIIFLWSLAISVVFTLIFALWGKELIGLMTNSEELLQMSTRYMIWLIIMPLLSAPAFVWDGIYVGATAGSEIRNCMIYAALGFIIAYVALYGLWGMQALYLAYFVHLLVRTVFMSVRWRKQRVPA